MAAQLRGADTVTLRHHRGDSSTSLAQARHSSSVPTTQGVGPSQCGGRIPGRNSARILDPDSIGRRSPRISRPNLEGLAPPDSGVIRGSAVTHAGWVGLETAGRGRVLRVMWGCQACRHVQFVAASTLN